MADPSTEIGIEDRLAGNDDVPQINKLFWGVWFTCHLCDLTKIING